MVGTACSVWSVHSVSRHMVKRGQIESPPPQASPTCSLAESGRASAATCGWRGRGLAEARASAMRCHSSALAAEKRSSPASPLGATLTSTSCAARPQSRVQGWTGGAGGGATSGRCTSLLRRGRGGRKERRGRGGEGGYQRREVFFLMQGTAIRVLPSWVLPHSFMQITTDGLFDQGSSP